MRETRDEPYLRHIEDSIGRIERYTAAGRDSFLTDPMVQDAVVRNLEVIGEAAKQLSEEARAAAPEIRWREIAGMRDKLIHQYFGVDLDVVWAVVERELEPLREAIKAILATGVPDQAE